MSCGVPRDNLDLVEVAHLHRDTEFLHSLQHPRPAIDGHAGYFKARQQELNDSALVFVGRFFRDGVPAQVFPERGGTEYDDTGSPAEKNNIDHERRFLRLRQKTRRDVPVDLSPDPLGAAVERFGNFAVCLFFTRVQIPYLCLQSFPSGFVLETAAAVRAEIPLDAGLPAVFTDGFLVAFYTFFYNSL